jgi:2-polyprenyl-3-methyl-5-hydroxy-6-metoxy-1,4-benzoquinol methylase
MSSAREQVERERDALIERHGEWTENIPLGDGVWTRAEPSLPHTRLRRIVQVIQDLAGRPLAECRILDVGCLEGMFSLELAQQGAEVLGMDARQGHIDKAQFAKAKLGLERAQFLTEDVRNLSPEIHGRFDVIVLSGLLYHLPADAGAQVLYTLHEMASRLVVIDTHVSLAPRETFTYRGQTYHGESWREHGSKDSENEIERRPLASYGNQTSFMFSRTSLVNLLAAAGFSSCYECLMPVHLNFGQPGIEHPDRCTFVALKGSTSTVITSPGVNQLREYWPEGALTYCAPGLDGQ